MLLRTVVALFCRLRIIRVDTGDLGAFVHWVNQRRPYGKLPVDVVPRFPICLELPRGGNLAVPMAGSTSRHELMRIDRWCRMASPSLV